MKKLESEQVPYMKSLSSCVNRMLQDGYTEGFTASDTGIRSIRSRKLYYPTDVQVVNFFRFEGSSDPDDNAVMYVIETVDGAKGILIDAYGAYADDSISRFMKAVESFGKKTTVSARAD
ncbi:MAG TPA: hypothetical protein VIK74_07100 [Parasegetibacter sp.]